MAWWNQSILHGVRTFKNVSKRTVEPLGNKRRTLIEWWLKDITEPNWWNYLTLPLKTHYIIPRPGTFTKKKSFSYKRCISHRESSFRLNIIVPSEFYTLKSGLMNARAAPAIQLFSPVESASCAVWSVSALAWITLLGSCLYIPPEKKIPLKANCL